MSFKSKLIKVVLIMGLLSVVASLFGCSNNNETVKIDGNEFIVLKVGEATAYKNKKKQYEINFIFTADETGVYTVWNQSDDYAFCRLYSDSKLDSSIYSKGEIDPFIKSFPLDAGETIYIGSINFLNDKNYQGTITIDHYDKAPKPYENIGFPIEINVNDVIPFEFPYNYTPMVFEFKAPEDGTYLFYTDGNENASPYLNIYTDPWCRTDSLIENIDHIEIPTDNYYIVEDSNFYQAMEFKKDDTYYLALAVRAANSAGNFYIKQIKD